MPRLNHGERLDRIESTLTRLLEQFRDLREVLHEQANTVNRLVLKFELWRQQQEKPGG